MGPQVPFERFTALAVDYRPKAIIYITNYTVKTALLSESCVGKLIGSMRNVKQIQICLFNVSY